MLHCLDFNVLYNIQFKDAALIGKTKYSVGIKTSSLENVYNIFKICHFVKFVVNTRDLKTYYEIIRNVKLRCLCRNVRVESSTSSAFTV